MKRPELGWCGTSRFWSPALCKSVVHSISVEKARCASRPPLRFGKCHPRATRYACPLTCQLMSKLLMDGVNAEGGVRRTLTFVRPTLLHPLGVNVKLPPGPLATLIRSIACLDSGSFSRSEAKPRLRPVNVDRDRSTQRR